MRRPYRIIAAILTLGLLLSLCSCGHDTPTLPHPGDLMPPATLPEDSSWAPVTAYPTETDTGTADPVFPSSPAEDPQMAEALIAAQALYQVMDDRDRIFQLFMVSPEILGLSPQDAVQEELHERPVSGLLYSLDWLSSPEQALKLSDSHAQASPRGIFQAITAESNQLNKAGLSTNRLFSMFTYRGDGTEKAYRNAELIAGDVRALGFNMNLAPVADIWEDPLNRFIGDRAYSDSYEKAGPLIGSALQAFHDRGLISVLKHFPGLGNASAEEGLPVVFEEAAVLRRKQLQPFAAGIAAGADMVLIGNCTVPSVSGAVPAPFSSELVSGLLRGELGFDGVIVCDLSEPALYGAGETRPAACVSALMAGCNLLINPAADAEELDECVSAILSALWNAALPRTFLEDSVIRILAVKIQYGIIEY